MSKFLGPQLAGVLLLLLLPAASSFADAPAAGNQAAATRNPDTADRHSSPDSAYASEVPKVDMIENKNGTTLATDNEEGTIPVAQELDFVQGNSFRKPYDESLKTVAEVEYYGTRYVDCESYRLEVRTARPDQTRTMIKTENSSKFEISSSSKGVETRGIPQGLAIEQERALVETFNFDTPVNELEKDNQVFKPLGMQKLPGMLTWKLEVDRPGSYHRILYVDSHTGDVVKFTVQNAQGARVLDVVLHDYRSVEGIRVPFAVDYRSSDGTLLANDRFERVEVKRRKS